MAIIQLDFVPPHTPGWAKLRIFEASEKTGPFVQIEEITSVGTYPNYITRYTTDQAASKTNWFQIEWESVEGATTDRSVPVKGGDLSLVAIIMDRVMLRDPSLDEEIVKQSVEFAIEAALSQNPYDASSEQTYRVLEGLTLLSLARASISSLATTSTDESYTAGLVSQRSGSGKTTSADLIKQLLAEANNLLGIATSIVMLLEDVDPTGMGSQSSISFDQTRLALTVNFD